MEDKRPILLLGGSGMLGQALAERLRSADADWRAPTAAQFDLAETDRIGDELRRIGPRAVINATAYSDVNAAEQDENRERAFRINRDVPEALAAACCSMGIPLLHVSTDYVFDGTKGEPYGESDPVAPLQVYGQSKLEGEQAVQRAYPDAVIVRTSTLFGPGRRPRPHYVDAILGQVEQKSVLEVVRMPVSSPTHAPDLALALLDLLRARANGLVHFANSGECSRLELARASVELAGFSSRARVVERPEPSGILRRPAYSALDNSLFTRWTGRPVRGWRAALEEYVQHSWNSVSLREQRR